MNKAIQTTRYAKQAVWSLTSLRCQLGGMGWTWETKQREIEVCVKSLHQIVSFPSQTRRIGGRY